MQLIKILLILFPVFNAFSQDLYLENKAIDFKTLQEITSTNQIRNFPIPNIGGNWKIVDLDTRKSTGSSNVVSLSDTYLVDIRDGKFIASLYIQANLEENPGITDWVDTPCSREDLLWKKQIGNKFKDINCARINHLVDFYSNPAGRYIKYYDVLTSNKIVLPNLVLSVEFTRHSSRGRRLQYFFNFNPEVMGFATDLKSSWANSSWHKNIILKDSEKSLFINELSSWASDFQDKMDSAFNKQAITFPQLQSFTRISTNNNFIEKKSVKLDNCPARLKLNNGIGCMQDFQFFYTKDITINEALIDVAKRSIGYVIAASKNMQCKAITIRPISSRLHGDTTPDKTLYECNRLGCDCTILINDGVIMDQSLFNQYTSLTSTNEVKKIDLAIPQKLQPTVTTQPNIIEKNTFTIAKEKWNKYFDSVNSETAFCVKTGMQTNKLFYESADPSTHLTLPDDNLMKDVYLKCDEVLKLPLPNQNFPCTLKDGTKSFCDSVYIEMTTENQPSIISRNALIQLHMKGLSWNIVNIENSEAKASRLVREVEAKNQESISNARNRSDENKVKNVEKQTIKSPTQPQPQKQSVNPTANQNESKKSENAVNKIIPKEPVPKKPSVRSTTDL